MKKIILISCTSKKRVVKAKAKDLYDKSPLFRKCLEYAELLKPDRIFILSAKHGLLDLEKEIKPYDVTLSSLTTSQKAKKPNLISLSTEERKSWAKKVLFQIKKIADLENDKFIFLASYRYIEFLISGVSNYDAPMGSINMFNQQAWLKARIAKLKKLK
ncbi:MAG: hypothetical protein KC733_00730 [Candidatus Omnitrophica bacterium]|nr:hypothetical protein [Candidatus Omnitrophota bacterium]